MSTGLGLRSQSKNTSCWSQKTQRPKKRSWTKEVQVGTANRAEVKSSAVQRKYCTVKMTDEQDQNWSHTVWLTGTAVCLASQNGLQNYPYATHK